MIFCEATEGKTPKRERGVSMKHKRMPANNENYKVFPKESHTETTLTLEGVGFGAPRCGLAHLLV